MTSKLNSAVNYAEHCLQMFIIFFFFKSDPTGEICKGMSGYNVSLALDGDVNCTRQ